MIHQVLKSIIVIGILFFHFTQVVESFQNKYVIIKRMIPLVTAKTRPLSTVDSQNLLGNIPRLEIGLRFLKTQTLKISKCNKLYSDIKFVNPMEWLKEQEMRTKSTQIFHIPSQLFQNARNSITSLSISFLRYMKKVAATAMIISSSFGIPNFKRLSTYTSSATAMISLMPSFANAGVFTKYKNLNPTQKLATTPLYFVCNSQGNAYLQDDVQAGKPDQKIVVYFMSSEDANDYLNEMTQGSSQNVNEFRIMATSMEKIVNKIQSRKQSRKLGRYPMSLVYRIQPSSLQCENAERIAGAGDSSKGSDALKGVSIPMFSAKGMAVKRSNGELVTPYYFAYEDLLDDWVKVVEESSDAKIPTKPLVVVKDFVEVMCLSQGLNSDALISTPDAKIAAIASTETDKILKSPAVVPPRREIELLKRYYRNEAGMKGEFQSARIMGMPR